MGPTSGNSGGSTARRASRDTGTTSGGAAVVTAVLGDDVAVTGEGGSACFALRSAIRSVTMWPRSRPGTISSVSSVMPCSASCSSMRRLPQKTSPSMYDSIAANAGPGSEGLKPCASSDVQKAAPSKKRHDTNSTTQTIVYCHATVQDTSSRDEIHKNIRT